MAGVAGALAPGMKPGIKIARKGFVKQSELHKELAYAVDCLTAEMAQRLSVRTDANKTQHQAEPRCHITSTYEIMDKYKGLRYSSYHIAIQHSGEADSLEVV